MRLPEGPGEDIEAPSVRHPQNHLLDTTGGGRAK
jgi:hypothetical protein